MSFKPIYFDVGSAGGAPICYRVFEKKGLMGIVGFDPGDDNWAVGHGRVDLLLGLHKSENYPIALGASDTKCTLHYTLHPGCSSLFKPNEFVAAEHDNPDWFKVVKASEIEVMRLDNAIEKFNLPKPHILKIDTQGYEGEILKGALSALSDICCIELEVHFLELYEGQATFSELHNSLVKMGFYLVDVRKQGKFGKLCVEGEAFYIKKDVTDEEKALIDIWCDINGLLN